MYQNPFASGYEVLNKTGFTADSHGSISTTASYLITNDFPDYATMFYHPTEHETITAIKYGNFENDYSNLREIRESLSGPPLEFYIPHSGETGDGVGVQSNPTVPAKTEKVPELSANRFAHEILKAQERAKNGANVTIEMEEQLFVKRFRKIVLKKEDI